MSDLINRLRALSAHEHSDMTIGDEAAAEIKRLITRITELAAEREELEAERDQALKLLDYGICPDPYCDNNGTVSNSNGEPEPCQWCDERNAVLAYTNTEANDE